MTFYEVSSYCGKQFLLMHGCHYLYF